jgi:hypothetical protein
VAQRLERIGVRVQHCSGAVDLLEHIVKRVAMNARRRARLERRSNPTGRGH